MRRAQNRAGQGFDHASGLGLAGGAISLFPGRERLFVPIVHPAAPVEATRVRSMPTPQRRRIRFR